MLRLPRNRLRWRHLGLGAKMAVVFIGYSVIMLTGLALVTYDDGREQAAHITRERLHGLTLAGAGYIHEFVGSIERDTRFLARSPALKRLRDAVARGRDVAVQNALREAERLLLAHAQSRPAVYQARILEADTGRELLRLQRDQFSGAFHPAPLQDKAHRDYVEEMKALAPGRLYISAVTLNRENGALERPLRPTVRFGFTLQDEAERPAVLVVLNVGFRHLAFGLARLYGDAAKLMIFNTDGQVLTHPDFALEFDFERADAEASTGSGPATGTLLTDLYGPAAALPRAEAVETGPGGTGIVHAVYRDGTLVALRRVSMHPQSERALILGAARDPALYGEALTAATGQSRFLALGLLAFGTLLFLVLGTLLLKPVRRLVDQVHEYEPGQGTAKPGRGMLERRDEFGYLARSLRAMAYRVEAQMRATREARNEMRRVFETATDAIILVSDLGVIEDVNIAAERMFGWNRHEMIGRRATVLLAPEDAELLSLDILSDGPSEEALAGLPGESGRRVRAVRRDGVAVPVTLALAELEDNRWRRYVVTLHDMRSVHALETARSESAAKSRFLANMSHELRTPLNAVTLHAEMIADEAEEADNAGMVEDARNIKTAANHLLDLINGILDLARIESGRLELTPEPTDLDSFVEELRSIGTALARKRNNAFDVETRGLPATVTVDRVRLRQCVLNLLSNAAKFTDGGRITVHLDCRPDVLRIAVVDTGVGMTEDETTRIFKMFEQANSYVHNSHGGSGVGLALTRSIMTLMGGEVSVASRPDAGTRFDLVVPLTGRVLPQAQEDAPEAGTDAVLVMVVDEDAERRAARTRLLARAGFRVIGATGPEDAVERADVHRPDLVLASGAAGPEDLPEAVDRLRIRPDLQGIPVLAIGEGDGEGTLAIAGRCGRIRPAGSGEAVLQTLSACLSCGGTGMVVVAEDDAGLLRAIARAIERAGLPVVRFATGDDAMAYLERTVPAFVLLDLALPGLDGFEIIRRMRESDRLAQVPVSVVTGIDLSASDEAWLKACCRAVHRKGDYTLDELTDGMLREVMAAYPRCVLPPEGRADHPSVPAVAAS